jgi:hypothetical protein
MCQSVGFGWGARRGPVSPLPLPPLAPQRAPPSSAPLPTPTYAKTAPPAAACTYLPPLGQRGKVCPWVYPWKRNAALPPPVIVGGNPAAAAAGGAAAAARPFAIVGDRRRAYRSAALPAVLPARTVLCWELPARCAVGRLGWQAARQGLCGSGQARSSARSGAPSQPVSHLLRPPLSWTLRRSRRRRAATRCTPCRRSSPRH